MIEKLVKELEKNNFDILENCYEDEFLEVVYRGKDGTVHNFILDHYEFMYNIEEIIEENKSRYNDLVDSLMNVVESGKVVEYE